MKKLAFLLLLSIPFLSISQGIDSSYFENYSQVINLNVDSSFQELPLMDSSLAKHDFFFTAEEHKQAVNTQIQFSFLKYLHQKAGVRNFLLEGGYSYAFMINRYLSNGDEKLLDKILQDIPICPENQRELFQKIRKYNLGLPDKDRIEVHGIDLESSPALAIHTLYYLMPETTLPSGIAKYMTKLVDLHNSPYFYESDVKKFFRKLARDIKTNPHDYIAYWSGNFEIFKMIVENARQGLGFTLIKATIFKKRWEKREARMYNNFLLIKDKMKPGKFYAQFGGLHTDIKTSSLWEFPSLANRLNYSESSPVKGKVLTISRYFRTLNSDYKKPGEYRKLQNMVSIAEKRFDNSIVLLSMIGKQTPFRELSKTFQYIMLIDPALEQISCE